MPSAAAADAPAAPAPPAAAGIDQERLVQLITEQVMQQLARSGQQLR
jgi:hypothetical protein